MCCIGVVEVLTSFIVIFQHNCIENNYSLTGLKSFYIFTVRVNYV